MSQQECVTGCGRPTRDMRLLCDHHVWELEQALAEIPALLDELNVTITRQDNLGQDRKVGKGPRQAPDPEDGKALQNGAKPQPLPFNALASEKLNDLRIFLVGWISDVAETHNQPMPSDELRAMSRWLLSRLDLLATHPAADDVYSEITSVVAHCWRAVDRAATKTKFVVGPCPEIGVGGSCLGEVWAYIPTREEETAFMSCAECGTRWETHQWMRAGRRILDRKGHVA